MPAVGLEPTRPREQQILSLPCMPFHHAGNPRRLYYTPRRRVKVEALAKDFATMNGLYQSRPCTDEDRHSIMGLESWAMALELWAWNADSSE